MNQARTGTMLYPLGRAKRTGTSWLWLGFAIFAVAVLLFTLAFVMGHAYGYQLASLKPAKVETRYLPPVTQFQCTAAERRAYVDACLKSRAKE